LAVVVAAHGLAAIALLNSPPEDADYGVDVPVVMLDLPESPVSSTAPAADLPPGPIQEEETLPTPPKEETKQPEPEAEVAIPIPEPPKPEPPTEEKHATAPPQANAPRVLVMRWQNSLRARIQRFREYPDKALSRGDEGSPTVEFTIDRDGRLVNSHIVDSSGSASLDDEALAVLVRAQPMPRPPDGLPDAELTITLPIYFHLKKLK
jgi:protein TonB